ncbi:MAG: hypothetical protein ABIK65_05915 [Candidatus Eisenbacteria bacterium]
MNVTPTRRRTVAFGAVLIAGFLILGAAGCGGGGGGEAEPPKARTEAAPAASKADEFENVPQLIDPKETALSNLVRLTFKGDNGEAYWNGEAARILWQTAVEDRHPYDQIYMMNRDGSEKRMVSTGRGRCTCSYFVPGTETFIYASTHLREKVPPKPAGRGGYEWAFDEAYDIFLADFSGQVIKRLTDTHGYDAEGTVSPSGTRLVWTSNREGDLEVYSMKMDGTDVKRITRSEGYDGGAFYSPDESMIVYRGSRTGNYRDLQIYVCDAEGKEHRRLTNNDKVNFAPYFHPDGDRIVFSSNMDGADPRDFDLYMMKIDGTELTRITYTGGFDGFPHFSDDGKTLLFCSNRADPTGGETDVYRADFTPYWQ